MSVQKILTIMVVAVLSLGCAACGVPGQFPSRVAATGPVDTELIQVPLPSEKPVDLDITFGPGKLSLSGGAEDGWVDGTARFNRPSLEPGIQVDESRAVLSSGAIEIANIGELNGYLVNDWSVRLGDVPMRLTMRAAGFEGDIDLGGVPIQALDYHGKAADVKWAFSTPNPVQMDTLSFDSIASDVALSGLANANFERMVFTSDLGDFTLDFSGQLQRSAVVVVESGTSEVDLIIPAGIHARVTVTGGLADVEFTDAWEKSGAEYSLPGSGPLLDIYVNMTLGTLNLRTQ